MAVEARVGSGRFKLTRRIGGGSFGEIYRAVDTQTKELVAVKMEPTSSKVPQLIYEARVLQFLQRKCISVGIPELRWYGSEGDFNIMVLELLGPSLERLFVYCEKRFTEKTVCMLADQLISRMEFLHARSFIHRDIKPENFVMGLGKKAHHVYMIDFGLAKRYREPKSEKHIPFREGKRLTGTARYVSVNTHLGMEQSRRDDLESLAYVLIYFASGTLPWVSKGGHKVDKAEKYERIAEQKAALSPEALCRFLPQPLFEFLVYVRSLQFAEDPDYDKCRNYFRAYLDSIYQAHDYRYDWLTHRDLQASKSVSSIASSNALNSSKVVTVNPSDNDSLSQL
jgi:casein kinase 1